MRGAKGRALGAAAAIAGLGVGLSAAPAAAAPAGGMQAVVRNIERFWAATGPRFYGRRIARVPQRRVAGLTPRTVRSFPCDGGVSWSDIEGNAVAAVCRQGPMVLWDATPKGVVAQMRRRLGPPSVGFIVAHEFAHVAQDQLGLTGSSLFMEQQADCFAGAYAAWSRTHGPLPLVRTPGDLDRITRATLMARDEPGTPARAQGAHGSGFDRVRAFHDGYLVGAAACKDYKRRLPPTFERAFQGDEWRDGGNMAYARLLPLVVPEIDAYFAAQEPGLGSFTLADVAQLADPTGCDTSVPTLLVCPASRTVYVDNAALRAVGISTGDGAVVALLSMAWAQAAAPTAVPGGSAVDWRACRAGNFFRYVSQGRTKDGGLSPGDLDEVLALLLSRAHGPQPGAATEAVLAFRVGVFGDRTTCQQISGSTAAPAPAT